MSAKRGGSLLAMPAVIAKKRNGGTLDEAEIQAVIGGAVRGAIPDYQLSALLMAIVWRGMGRDELVSWTQAMIESGERLRWPRRQLRRPLIDKHSTGGVGDKISLVLAPVAAAAGLAVPMMAGRALGHTGGTLDKLETIPGFRTALSPVQLRRVLTRAGCVLAGQTSMLAPADRILYALRDATATVESIPLIASSILSKKVAEGAAGLVMDVKAGSGAFLPDLGQTRALARTLVGLGGRLGLPVRALLTDMDQPLGAAVGNALEVREAIDVLRGGGPPDVRALTLRLGAEMLVLGGRAADRASGARMMESALGSGAGLERFRQLVVLQGGDPAALDDPDRVLPRARHRRSVIAARGGFVVRADAGALGRAATLLGAGRLRKENSIAPGAGLLVLAKVGATVRPGDRLCEVMFDDVRRARAAWPLIERAFRISSERPARRPLVLETIGRVR